MAQLVEHILGKDEVPGSNPGSSSKKSIAIAMDFFICAARHNIICVAHATSFER